MNQKCPVDINYCFSDFLNLEEENYSLIDYFSWVEFYENSDMDVPMTEMLVQYVAAIPFTLLRQTFLKILWWGNYC